jgi:hypothetical protein
MRDVYPLVITGEHMTILLLNDATVEEAVWLPPSLCFKAIRLETIICKMRMVML